MKISLPDHIESEKIYQKYCQEYPQIKPTFERKIINQTLDHSAFTTSYHVKIKRGEYVWKNQDIIVTFSFPEFVEVTAEDWRWQTRADDIKEAAKHHEIKIIDRMLYDKLVASKKAEYEKAEKAKKDAADKAALDF